MVIIDADAGVIGALVVSCATPRAAAVFGSLQIALNARGIPKARGDQWQAQSVANILQRA